MGYDKGSRLSQRHLGVTGRTWALILLILFIIVFTHYALPTNHLVPGRQQLKPKIYFNDTDSNPFEFCPVHGPGDQLAAKYGVQTLSKSTLHLGSGERVKKLLTSALTGQPVTISILGGSVSACHGAGDDPVSPKCYPSLFFEWWNSVFPHPATELTNGAMRRTNSGYFAFCSGHHLPDVTDLVIIELDSEDHPGNEMMENFETLIRSILLRPDSPAILLLGHFSPQVHQEYGFVGPDHWHHSVAQFYDVPYITIKPALYPSYMQDQHSVDKYYVDPVLSSPLGHQLIRDILVAYFQSQICNTWTAIASDSLFDTARVPSDASHRIFGGAGARKGVPEPPKEEKAKDNDENKNIDNHKRLQQQPSSPVPPARMNTRSGRPFEEIAPFCVSANDLINPLPPSLFYGSGWIVYHRPSGHTSNGLQTTSHYWYSALPTSKIRIPLQVGAGDIGVYYLKEPVKDVGEEGSEIKCWVDDNHAGAKAIRNAGKVDEPTPTLEVIDRFVSRGSHFVECVLQGEAGQSVPMFKIIGIFST